MNNYFNYKNYNFKGNYSDNINKNKKEEYLKNDFNYNETNSNSLYNPYQGFIRGNMFEKLYDQYKIKEPYDIRPMNEQAELLTYIDSLSFACIDLNLYLDINPNDRDKINLFNQYRKQKKQLIEEYENKYGPLSINSNSLDTYPWAWDDRPWPWEN